MTDSVLNWIFETGIAVTLLIAFILVIRRPFARRFGARMTYALWALPVLRLFMPAIVLPALPAPIIEEAATPIYIVPAAGLPAVNLAEPVAPTIPWSSVVLVVWGVGIVVWLGWQLFMQRRFRRTVTRNSRPIPGSLQGIAARTAHRLGLKRIPEIRLASDKIGPLVTGPLNPVVVLPNDFETNYSDAQQAFALGHELTHIRRLDLWAAFAGLLFRAVNWPNPLIHYAAEKFRADQEAACDASVLAMMGEGATTKHDYAETLLHAARRTVRLTQPRPLGLTIYHPLKERLMILNTQQSQASVLSRVMATALIASAIVISAPFTRAQDPGSDDLAGDKNEFVAKTVEKKVIEMIENVDGVETKKKYEIITENGETKAYEYDEFGNKLEIDPDSVKGLKMHGENAFVFKHGGMSGQDVDIQILTDDIEGGPHKIEKRMVLKLDEVGGMDKEQIQAFIEKHGGADGANVFAFSSDKDMEFDFKTDGHAWVMGDGHHAGLVTAAKRLAEQAGDADDLSRDQRRKLDKAIKALEEAQKALEE